MWQSEVLKGANMNSKSLEQLLDLMWKDYSTLNPAALKILQLFTQKGEKVLNDHVAYRTFNHPRLGIKSLAAHVEKYGYKAKGEYFFKEKKLYAQHFEHTNLDYPKIFISELELEKMETFVQEEVEKMVQAIPDSLIQSEKILVCGRPWKVAHSTYSQLAKVSEYAAWVSAFGFRPNHFTVNVNALKGFNDLQSINQFIKQNGFSLNQAGGEIKGTPSEFLEQSSTMAEEVEVEFLDGKFKVPACYYEFARRFETSDGKLYQGFIAKSADKIFESTNRKN